MQELTGPIAPPPPLPSPDYLLHVGGVNRAVASGCPGAAKRRCRRQQDGRLARMVSVLRLRNVTPHILPISSAARCPSPKCASIHTRADASLSSTHTLVFPPLLVAQVDRHPLRHAGLFRAAGNHDQPDHAGPGQRYCRLT